MLFLRKKESLIFIRFRPAVCRSLLFFSGDAGRRDWSVLDKGIMTKKEKWILVTGASTGIGRAAAEYLAANGFNVYACARKQADLDELAAIDNITSIELDVTKDEDVADAADFVRKQGTGLYGLLNNAGVANAGPLMDLDVGEIEKQFDINLFGVHRVTKAFFPFLLESKGRIVMMSSDSGFFATPFFGPYCSAKFALEGYSDSLRRELMTLGVKVVIIQPGRINTPIWDKGERLLAGFSGSIFEKQARALGEYAIRKGKTTGLPPVEAAEAVFKAFTRKKPKLRYLIAPNKKKYYIIKVLPGIIVDRMIKKELDEI